MNFEAVEIPRINEENRKIYNSALFGPFFYAVFIILCAAQLIAFIIFVLQIQLKEGSDRVITGINRMQNDVESSIGSFGCQVGGLN